MLLINMLCISVPLGYTIANIAPSGAYTSDYHRWIDPAFDGTGNGCDPSDRVVACTSCLVNGINLAETVCFQTTDGAFTAGVQTTLGDLCDVCPSGCGPYRNFPSVYQVLVLEYRRWPVVLRTVVNYIGTIAFGAVLVLALLTWVLILKAKVNAHSRLIEKIRIERDLERMDKVWILERWAITLDGDKAQRT
jgi:hypothetical protein